MSYLPGKFVWFDHLAPDLAAARAFYQPLFGWHIEASLQNSHEALVLRGKEPIGTFRRTASGAPARWLPYLSVADLDRSVQTAVGLGARLLSAPEARGDWGRGALLSDPHGAELQLWRSARGDRPDLGAVAIGDFCWTELQAPDAAAATAFYEQVAGMSHELMDMGPFGLYRVLKSGGQARSGVQALMPGGPNIPVMWLPYVRVENCDRTAAQALHLDGEWVVAPADIPEVGRHAVLRDPQGALLAILEPVVPA